MKLFYNRPSPYARKVLVVAHEKRLMHRIELCAVDPWSDPTELLAVTPIGKIPALLTDDGLLITESAAIATYLDAVGDGPTLAGGTEAMARAGLAQGLIDAAFGIVIERRRPKASQWEAWIERQRRAIERTLARLDCPSERFDLGDISLACGLAYLDFRLGEIPWRDVRPELAAWLDGVTARSSMRATAP